MQLTVGQNTDAGLFLGIPAFAYDLSTLQNNHVQLYMDVQGVFLSTTSGMDVHCAGCIPVHHQWYGRALCRVYAFQPSDNFCKCRNAGLCGFWPVRCQNEKEYRCRNQTGIGMIRYRNEISDAVIPMPVASALMPMPSYAVRS
jgi:hypothetical protein